jgi:hypothetical protein
VQATPAKKEVKVNKKTNALDKSTRHPARSATDSSSSSAAAVDSNENVASGASASALAALVSHVLLIFGRITNI